MTSTCMESQAEERSEVGKTPDEADEDLGSPYEQNAAEFEEPNDRQDMVFIAKKHSRKCAIIADYSRHYEGDPRYSGCCW